METHPSPEAEAPSATLRTLKKRASFLSAAKGRRWNGPLFSVQMRDRADGDPAIGVGFTVTKRVGGAVVRNRIKRRLRAASAQLKTLGRTGADYVLVGRIGAFTADFSKLLDDLNEALVSLKSSSGARKLRRGRRRPSAERA
ncbi:MAG: ribonuclease P protein component [Pseudomonadota bacterium]